MKVRNVKFNTYLQKHKQKKISLNSSLYSTADLKSLASYEKKLNLFNKIVKLTYYSSFYYRHPKKLFNHINIDKPRDHIESRNYKLQKNNLIKATIAKCHKPKKIFEIGTYLGAGALAFKKVNKSAKVYTLNLKNDKNSNNPIKSIDVGKVFKNKNTNIQQLWGDSLTFDYSDLGKVDVSFIDGNHLYKYVIKDLVNMALITSKCIILDDYWPINHYNYSPWNEGVVRAVDEFLKYHSHIIENVYWISGTPYCVFDLKNT